MSHCLPVGGSVRVENEVRVAGFPDLRQSTSQTPQKQSLPDKDIFDPCLILQSSVSKTKSHIVFLVTWQKQVLSNHNDDCPKSEGNGVVRWPPHQVSSPYSGFLL